MVGAGFGILGLMWICFGCWLVLTSIRESELFQMLCMASAFFIFGGIAIVAGWQSIRYFGTKAIQSVVALVAYSVYIGLLMLRSFLPITLDQKMRLHSFVTFFVPVLIAYLLYRVLTRKLIEITETKNIQQIDGGDS